MQNKAGLKYKHKVFFLKFLIVSFQLLILLLRITGSASSSHTMTASTVKDPTSLAFRIMMDTKTELQAVEKMQHLSVQHNKQETNRLRQEFAERRPEDGTSPTGDRRSPKVHFEDEAIAPKPSIAPKPRPRVDPSVVKPNQNARVTPPAAKGVRFNDVPIAIEAESESDAPIETVRPPPGYENDSEKGEDVNDHTPGSQNAPKAPPPYNVAVNHRNNSLISHTRQSEIQQPESIVEFLPKKSTNHRRQLSDSREQLVDGSDYDDYAYYENGGFEVSDSEFEHHRANFVAVTSTPPPVTPNYVNNSALSTAVPYSNTMHNPAANNNRSNSPLKIKPAIKPYAKQNHTFKPQVNLNGLDLPPYPKAAASSNTEGMDYVNVYEEPPAPDERFIADIHNHFVEDLYPESNTNAYQQRPNRNQQQNTNSRNSPSWGYNSNASTGNAAPFYLYEGMKASEC